MPFLIFALIYQVSVMIYTTVFVLIAVCTIKNSEFNGTVLGSIFLFWAPLTALAITGIIVMVRKITIIIKAQASSTR